MNKNEICTKTLFQKYVGNEIKDAIAEEIEGNLKQFFQILIEWIVVADEDKEMKGADNEYRF